MKAELLGKLGPYGQEHLLAFWDELDAGAQRRLAAEIEQVDFELVSKLVHGQEDAPDWAAMAAKAQPPQAVRLDRQRDPASRAEAHGRGEAALRAGKVGMILVAGGQGTRLGFDQPKGMFPLGSVSERTLFEILIDRLRALGHRYGVRIPLYLMTSPATHEATVEFFEQHDRLGLPADDLRIFCQGVMPAVDAESGKVLLADRSSVFLSPDGHGGMLAALERSGGLADARQRGVEQLFYGQVDNPLLQVCDPLLIGYHLLADSEMTTQVVQKVAPLEKVGNVVEISGRTQILEYSDLPDEIAHRTAPDGTLWLWAGNLAVHVLDRRFLERVTHQADVLPFHRARKKAEHVDRDGQLVKPEAPNAIKFERFIFDLLPSARKPIVVEATKAEAFAPVKNGNGAASDTPQAAQEAMVRLDAEKLRQAGARIADGVAVEINPLWAVDAEEIARKIRPGTEIREPTYFH